MTTRFFTGRQARSTFFLLCGLLMGVGLTFHAITSPVNSIFRGTPPADASGLELPAGRIATPKSASNMLVLYDSDTRTDTSDQFAELNALQMINTLGHFGAVEYQSVNDYQAGGGSEYDLVTYISVVGRKVPEPVLQDVLSGEFTALWVGLNGEQLADYDESFSDRFGWSFRTGKPVPVDEVVYKDAALPRADISTGVRTIDINDKVITTPYGEARFDGASQGTWAVRSRHLTFVGEVPFNFQERADRSLVMADLLFDLLDPDRSESHQALVRIEDVGPWADPEGLRQIADVLYERDVPFSVAVYPIWEDPKRVYQFEPKVRLADRPEVVEALKYMVEKGGTLLMHGLTHQFGEEPNPYQGVSGEDFEFVTAQIDEDDNVVIVGPVPGDSPEWMLDRVTQSFAEFTDAGLPEPTIFEFSHYAGSAVDYRAITETFDARFDQGTYYVGHLSGEPADYSADAVTPIVPYPIYDAYGEYVIPENLGNVIPVGYNNNDPIKPQDIVDNAARSLVVRDNVAGFFFHPYLEIDLLVEIVDGIQETGYRFVSPDEALSTWLAS